MTRNGYFLRLALSVAVDLLDFTIGRLFIGLPIGDGVGTVITVLLWGWPGLFYAGEFLDFTEQIDGFVPSATLIAIGVGLRDGYLFGRGPSKGD